MNWIMQRLPYVILGMLALTLIPISYLDTYRSNQSYAKPSYQLEQRQKRNFGFKLIDGLTAHPCSKYEHANTEDYVNCIKHEDHISQSYMKSAAWWQLLATIAGLILIWRTLVHSRNATEYAQETVNVAKSQLRAVIRIKSCNIKPDKAGGYSVGITYENTGQSLANNVKHDVVLDCYEKVEQFPSPLSEKDAARDRSISLSQSDSKATRISVDPIKNAEEIKKFTEGGHFHLNGIFTYSDIFGEAHFLKYAFQIKGPNGKGRMNIIEMLHS